MRKHAWILAFLMLGCGGGGSPTAPSCQNIAGNWTAAVANSCGFSGSTAVTVTQTGCSFNTSTPSPFGIAVSGTISGGSAVFTVTFGSPCNGSATGTATLSGNAFSGTFSGTNAGAGCCGPNISGSFTLTR